MQPPSSHALSPWLLGAAGSALVTLLATLLGGALTPGYSHLSMYISELGARGAPLEWPLRLAGFLPAGLLMLAFCVAAWRALPHRWPVAVSLLGLVLYALGYLIAVVFPCDLGCRPAEPSLSQVIHNAGGLLGYLLAPLILLLMARQARAWREARHLVWSGHAAAALALCGLLTLAPESPLVGLSQRAIEAAILLWFTLLGLYLRRVPNAVSERTEAAQE